VKKSSKKGAKRSVKGTKSHGFYRKNASFYRILTGGQTMQQIEKR